MRNTTFINDFTPSLHESLFNKAQRIGAKKAMERYNECVNGTLDDRGPARIFAGILFGGIMRAEYANEKIRDVIADMREDKSLYRHDIKKLCNDIRKRIARFDTYTSRSLNKQYIDFYDELTGSAGPQFDKMYLPFYYSMLQFMTRNRIKHGDIIAKLECAVALLDFSATQYRSDVGEFRYIAPAIMALSDNLEITYAPLASELLRRVSAIATRGVDKKFDVNEDKNIRISSDNLFNMLGNPNAMNNYLVIDPESIPSIPKELIE